MKNTIVDNFATAGVIRYRDRKVIAFAGAALSSVEKPR
jgi:hypothetical protein